MMMEERIYADKQLTGTVNHASIVDDKIRFKQ